MKRQAFASWLVTAVLIGFSVVAAALNTPDGWAPALGAVIGLALLVDIALPGSGSVPVGHAGLIALAALGTDEVRAISGGVALLVALPVLASRRGLVQAAVRLIAHAVSYGLACVAAAGVASALDGREPLSDQHVLIVTLAAGVAYLAADVASALTGSQRTPLRARWGVDVSLLCASALLSLAAGHGGIALVALATGPLLVTRYSFGRYVESRETHAQVIEALSILPEVAALAPIGHAERTAAYAWLIAQELGLNQLQSEAIVVAAKLHHLGTIGVPGADAEEFAFALTRDAMARGAALLRATGGLAHASEVLSAMESEDGHRPAAALSAAIVRAASDFDDLVEEEPQRVRFALALLAGRGRTAITRRAYAGLIQTALPEVVETVIATARDRRMSSAASSEKNQATLATA
jgi:hypothetical protein